MKRNTNIQIVHIHLKMVNKKRVLSPQELRHLQEMLDNKIPSYAIAKELKMGKTTLDNLLPVLAQQGMIKMASEPKIRFSKGKIDENEPPETENENKTDTDPLQAPTVKAFTTKAANKLSDVMVDFLKSNMEAAATLQEASMLYQSNVEAMGFNWIDWIKEGLKDWYRWTQEWYMREKQKIKPERVMEDYIEEQTMREVLKEM